MLGGEYKLRSYLLCNFHKTPNRSKFSRQRPVLRHGQYANVQTETNVMTEEAVNYNSQDFPWKALFIHVINSIVPPVFSCSPRLIL
jgi:hypothetical protein